jgi:hypothetical protein
MRCPNADTEVCSYPKCGCHKPARELQATKTLSDYIHRVVEAEKGLPKPMVVDVSPIHFVMDVLYHKKETLYLAGLLKEVLDKAKEV